jgi:hypothetical protein
MWRWFKIRPLTAGLWSVMLAKPVLHSGCAGAGMASLAGPRPSPGGMGRLDGRVVAGLILVRRGLGFEATRSALPKMDNLFAIHRWGTRKTG